MIRNFIFHRVSSTVRDNSIEMDVRLFEKCIQYITSRYQVVCIEDVLQNDFIKKRRDSCASLTFDDGYADNIEFAAPILEKYNCRASFYVITDCVEKNIPPWSALLGYLFFHTHIPTICLDTEMLPEKLKIKILPTDLVHRMAWFIKLKTWMKRIPVAQKEILFLSLCAQLNDVELPRVMMGWKELAALRNDGHYIGSHTHTHNALTMMENESSLLEELSLPRELIKRNLGYLPLSIAYPFGFYNEKIKKISSRVGYKLGIASDRHQLFNINRHDHFEIPRIALCNESWFKTRLRITNRIEQIKNIVPKKLIYSKNGISRF